MVADPLAQAPAITGVGAVSPAGRSTEELWWSALHNRSNFSTITHFDASRAITDVAGFVPTPAESPGDGNRLLTLALASIGQAIAAAGLRQLSGVQLVMGTTEAGGHLTPETAGDGTGPISNLNLAARIAAALQIEGPAFLLGDASASGAAAIAYACDLVALGETPVAIACGVDCVTRTAYYGLNSLRVLSRDGCRPFNARRTGIRVSEGSGAMVIESPDSARRRGASPRGRIVGWGVSNHTRHLMKSGSEGIRLAILQALAGAGLKAADVIYVNAHGAGTMQGDAEEIEALRAVFGQELAGIRINSSKPVLGHCQGAAGTLEAIVTLLALESRTAPPTFGLESPDPAWQDLDLVQGSPAPLGTGIGLTLSSGLGGINVALALDA